jgi:hypothetical protein
MEPWKQTLAENPDLAEARESSAGASLMQRQERRGPSRLVKAFRACFRSSTYGMHPVVAGAV